MNHPSHDCACVRVCVLRAHVHTLRNTQHGFGSELYCLGKLYEAREGLTFV